MKSTITKNKLIEEIQKLPEYKLAEIYDFVHYLRLGLETKESNPKKLMQFAGCWKDMKDSDFDEFINDISIRRKKAFLSRKNRESCID